MRTFLRITLAKDVMNMDNIPCGLDHWCSGPTCLPVTEKITSSNLVWSAKYAWPGSSDGSSKGLKILVSPVRSRLGPPRKNKTSILSGFIFLRKRKKTSGIDKFVRTLNNVRQGGSNMENNKYLEESKMRIEGRYPCMHKCCRYIFQR